MAAVCHVPVPWQQKVMPEATHMRNGKLGMSYDVIAMMNTIALARKVQELEEEIRKIKAS